MWRMFIIRLIGAGFVAALVPVVASRLSPRLAGIVMLVPVITICSLYFLGRDQGQEVVRQTALGGIEGLVYLAAFLLTVAVTAGPLSTVISLISAGAVWLATVVMSRQRQAWFGLIAAVVILAVQHIKDIYGLLSVFTWGIGCIAFLRAAAAADVLTDNPLVLMPFVLLAIFCCGGIFLSPYRWPAFMVRR